MSNNRFSFFFPANKNLHVALPASAPRTEYGPMCQCWVKDRHASKIFVHQPEQSAGNNQTEPWSNTPNVKNWINKHRFFFVTYLSGLNNNHFLLVVNTPPPTRGFAAIGHWWLMMMFQWSQQADHLPAVCAQGSAKTKGATNTPRNITILLYFSFLSK